MSIDELFARKSLLEEQLQRFRGAQDDRDHSVRIFRSKIKDSHWDSVIKEACWLSEDFQKERLRHSNNAKKVIKGVEAYSKTLDSRRIKREKDDVIQHKKIASRIARDVRKFWIKVDKVLAFVEKVESDEIREKAMDEHLHVLLEVTSKFVRRVSVAFTRSTGQESDSHHQQPHRLLLTSSSAVQKNESSDDIHRNITSWKRNRNNDDSMSVDSDGEFELNDDSEQPADNEESTMEEQENWERQNADETGENEEDELAALQAEQDLPIEELLKRYNHAPDASDDEDAEETEESTANAEQMMDVDECNDGDQSFTYSKESSIDNESTMAEQEAWEQSNNPLENGKENELFLLQREGEMSIEDLRMLYANIPDDDDPDDSQDNDEDDDSHEDESNEKVEKNDGIDDNLEENAPVLQSQTQLVNSVDPVNNSNNGEDEEEGEHSFAPSNEDEADNESTMAEQEAWERSHNGDANEDREYELQLLRQEGEMSIEDLRKMYANMPDNDIDDDSDDDDDAVQEHKHQTDHTVDVTNDNDDELSFAPSEQEEIDNESTFDEQLAWEQEQHDNDNDHEEEDELQLLQQEANMSVEELRQRYQHMQETDEISSNNDDEADAMDETSNESNFDDEDDDADDNDSNQQQLVPHPSNKIANKKKEATMEVPFLLVKSLRLREYQLRGIQWLISLEENALNGILADEMGLGKTIQTIALLADLVTSKGIWGPHLIVVPTSCIVNWETELKKFCPAFKVLSYFGSTKARKQLRNGWSRPNAFHICITSYQLVVQDASAFKRKQWYFLILDEAHNIKNFKSKRWQTLLGFNSVRRLLLTGTPLQNTLMELWSLMHFLMPAIFSSRKEFAYWFSNPLESSLDMNNSNSKPRQKHQEVVRKLHDIMRPFILRRLKSEVARQLPKKIEQTVYCKLSKRQQLLYEEFISRATAGHGVADRGYLAMMNLLMQLRKICDHPDLIEPRMISSPYFFPGLSISLSNTFNWHFLNNHSMNNNNDNSSRRFTYFWEDVNLDGDAWKVQEVIVDPNARYKRDWERRLYLRLQRRQSETITKPSNSSIIIQSELVTFQHVVNVIRSVVTDVNSNKTSFIQLLWESSEMESLISYRALKISMPRAISPGPRHIIPVYHPLAAHVNTVVQLTKNTPPLRLTKLINRYLDFPDKSMIQHDSGKLVVLGRLLANKRRGGHKCLIFTQMSKMLDILEAFLSLHDFSFVRLDGSTSIDQRQKLMDRFNSDPKLFCFILSTRSGGLGINLTGADTVIFYDTDWNPAMDAQAQDRAHRIGQTRDVYIYRLVTEGTIEENILKKANQRRQLDSMVISKGRFSETALHSLQSVSSILGVADNNMAVASAAEMEAAMAAAEDSEDIAAKRALEADDAADFGDEPVAKVADTVANSDDDSVASDVNRNEQKEELKEDIIKSENDALEEGDDQALQQSLGNGDIAAFTNRLQPVERYALNFHRVHDPHHSQFYRPENTKIAEISASAVTIASIQEIEDRRIHDEEAALDSGDIICAEINDGTLAASQRWFDTERRQRRYARLERLVGGSCWEERTDQDGIPYFFNVDTLAYSYSAPPIIQRQRELQYAREMRYNGLHQHLLLHIFSFLETYPDRLTAATVCARWRVAASDDCFVKKVLPVESGIRDTSNNSNNGKLGHNTFASLEDALKTCSPGDTIELFRGHYWESNLIISVPVRIFCHAEHFGTEDVCIVEIKSTVEILQSAKRCVFQGIAFRPSTGVTNYPSLSVSCPCFMAESCGFFGTRETIAIKFLNCSSFLQYCVLSGQHGIESHNSRTLLGFCTVKDCSLAGVVASGGEAFVEDCTFHDNTTSIVLRNPVGFFAASHCEFRNSTVNDGFHQSSRWITIISDCFHSSTTLG